MTSTDTQMGRNAVENGDSVHDSGPASVCDVIDRMESSADGDETTLREVVSALGEASFVPVLMAPALAVLSPLSGVPAFSSICGITIALVAIQLLMNRDHLWLPDWMMRRKVKSESLLKATRWLRKPAGFLDRMSRERVSFLVSRPFSWVTELACLLCGLAMPFLELLPFTSSILGGAVTLFSLSLLVRDGLISVIGFCVIGCAATLVYMLVV
ncbi:exopolysaccharide biosynthesis protein [Psychromarinibacter halotolerans]|uniref:Exopolysaccharide biosynthesis protein n=1 Tax=Psychromarinibacter halotolerans TaxID=1775175 RepID=A0ABV7GKP6_9RHOB|nr:exopolysaccharide biosynthesis protein [Psychromarinibacter halotolerans]MDF0595384.1 exopolysaccharide biosynthesis protein [Psychromarinibacter halotolerans]